MIDIVCYFEESYLIADHSKDYRVLFEKPSEKKDSEKPKSIFLAGPTQRNSVGFISDEFTGWRKEFINKFPDAFNAVMFVPEFREKMTETDLAHIKWDKIHEWEWNHLVKADMIVIWVPRDIENGLPGFTTNVEFGLCMGNELLRDKTIYGRPLNTEGCRYLDDMYKNWRDLSPCISMDYLIDKVVTRLFM